LPDLRQGRFDGGGDFGVFGVYDARDFEGRLQVEILGGTVRLLGWEGTQLFGFPVYTSQKYSSFMASLALAGL
jgi:hypothetical protein